MSFRSDDRGAAIQVGAIILFAFVVIAITAYQASVVPNQNNQIEYNHNQQLQSQLQDLEGAIGSTSSAGERRTVTVDLGTEYPARTIFINPPNPAGRLDTIGANRDAVAFEIRNATAVDEDVSDFWNGDPHNYSTGSVVYRPNYNVYSEAPTTVIENSLVYNRFDASNITVKEQSMFDGNEISLTALRGSLSEQGRTATVGVEPVSVSSKTITVEDTSGDPVTVTTVSMLSRSEWHSMLDDAGEFHNASGHVQAVRPNGTVSLPNGETAYRIDFVMEPGEDYTLQIASVGVGDLSESQEATTANYTVAVTDRITTDEGVTESVTVEVRDAYNNPKAGVAVNASVSGAAGGSLDISSGQTNSEGRVTFEYEAGNIDGEASKTDHVNVSFTGDPAAGFDAADPANVSVDVTVRNTDRSGMSGGGNGAYGVFWQEPGASNTGSPCDADRCVVDGGTSLPLLMGTNPVADGANVQYAVNDTSVAELARTTGTTNASGENATVLEFNSAGTVRVYASSGAGGDTIVVEIQLASGVVWKETLDWDSAVSEDGVVHEGFGDRESDRVAVGYPSGGEWGPEPIGYWPLDETGDPVEDVTDSGYDGSTVGDPSSTPGVLGTTGYEFDNGGDAVQIDSGPGGVTNEISDDTFTWAFWTRPVAADKSEYDTMIGVDRPSGGYPFTLDIYSGELVVFTENDDSQFTGIQLNDGNWHHVVATYDGTDVDIYVDGTYETTVSTSTSLESADEAFIGSSESGDYFFEGDMEEVQVYGSVLSGAEVQQLYDASAGGELETDARSSGSEFNVSTLELTNVSVDPNGGAVTVYVQSDHDEDGTFEETSDPVTLSAGTSTYDVNGLSTDSSNFSLRIELSTADVTSSPWVSAIEINGSTAGGGSNPPSITNFEATNPSGQTVEVSFDSSKTLSDIEVDLDYDSNGSTAETLTTSDFTESGGTYTATTTLPTGSYTAFLQTAADNDGNDGAMAQTDSVTVSTPGTGPPAVTSASVSDAPINYSDAAPGETKTVTVTFNQSMDTTVDPTVEIQGMASSYTVTGGYVDDTTWTGSVSFNQDNEETTATIRVANAEDQDGNTMAEDTSNTFQVDTARPQQPSNTNFQNAPITASNEQNVDVDVVFGNPPESGTVYVRITGPDGNTVTGTAPANTAGTTTTVTGIDTSSLADGTVTAESRIIDDAGNVNQGGYRQARDAEKDTQPPVVEQFDVTDQSSSVGNSGKWEAEYEVTNLVSDANLDSVTIELVHTSDGVVATATGANQTHTLTDPNQCGNNRLCEYTIRITATDQFGQTTQLSVSDTADGVGGGSATSNLMAANLEWTGWSLSYSKGAVLDGQNGISAERISVIVDSVALGYEVRPVERVYAFDPMATSPKFRRSSKYFSTRPNSQIVEYVV